MARVYYSVYVIHVLGTAKPSPLNANTLIPSTPLLHLDHLAPLPCGTNALLVYNLAVRLCHIRSKDLGYIAPLQILAPLICGTNLHGLCIVLLNAST